jgi:hypothetical protein
MRKAETGAAEKRCASHGERLGTEEVESSRDASKLGERLGEHLCTFFV